MCADYRHASAPLVYEDQPHAQPRDTHMLSAHPSTAPAAETAQALYGKITRKLSHGQATSGGEALRKAAA